MMCSAVLFSCRVQDRKKVQSSPDKLQVTPTTVPVYSLEGKTFVFLGSSVTFGSASGGWSMCEYLEENFNCTVRKSAISGTTLAEYATNSYVSRMKQIEKREGLCDHFICQLSTNDASIKLPLGEISNSKNNKDFDTKTIIGAMEYIIAAAQEKWDCQVSFYTGTKLSRRSSNSATVSGSFVSGTSLYASFSSKEDIGRRMIVHAILNAECATAIPERDAA